MSKGTNYCLMTNDVETTSITHNYLSDETGEKVLRKGMPKLLKLYKDYNIKSTFFFTGYIAEKFPEVVSMVLPYGHEVGCHGYSHKTEMGFDLLNYSQQVEHLKKAKGILENISGEEVISFRAPALRVNKFTPKALLDTGFKIDSSTSAQRIDMFFSHGSKKKLNWLIQPRLPYFVDINNIWKKGNSQLFEVPISAIAFPYIGTFMRIFPLFIRLLHSLLHFETRVNKKPVVFLLHPNELIREDEDEKGKHYELKNIKTKSSNISYYLKNVIRHKLKLNNLGEKASLLFDKELKFFVNKNYKFATIRDYYYDLISHH